MPPVHRLEEVHLGFSNPITVGWAAMRSRLFSAPSVRPPPQWQHVYHRETIDNLRNGRIWTKLITPVHSAKSPGHHKIRTEWATGTKPGDIVGVLCLSLGWVVLVSLGWWTIILLMVEISNISTISNSASSIILLMVEIQNNNTSMDQVLGWPSFRKKPRNRVWTHCAGNNNNK